MPDTQLPDPSPSEARALIFGAGTFWLMLATAVVIAQPPWTHGEDPNGSPWALIPAFCAFAAGTWLFVSGVYHVLARSRHTSVSELMVSPGEWGRRGIMRDSLRVVLPGYWRRAARSLGFNETLVLVMLGTLLAAALAVTWLG